MCSFIRQVYINNDNDDKTVDVEILVKSENATKNKVKVEECLKTIEVNKPEPEDTTHDKV